MPSLMDKAGELGLLGVSIPEEYVIWKGLCDFYAKCSRLPVADIRFDVGISQIPVFEHFLFYTMGMQNKAKYIPKLASGEWKGCYCLELSQVPVQMLTRKSKSSFKQRWKALYFEWTKNVGLPTVVLRMSTVC